MNLNHNYNNFWAAKQPKIILKSITFPSGLALLAQRHASDMHVLDNLYILRHLSNLVVKVYRKLVPARPLLLFRPMNKLIQLVRRRQLVVNLSYAY